MPILGYQSKFYKAKLISNISKKSFGFDKCPIFSLKNHSTLLGSTSMNVIAERDRVMRFCIPLFCAKQDVKVSQYLLIFAKIFDVNFENCVSEYSAKGHCVSEYSVKGSKTYCRCPLKRCPTTYTVLSGSSFIFVNWNIHIYLPKF